MTLFPDDIHDLAGTVVAEATAIDLKLAVAESCTGGLVAGALTAIPGSSAALDRGFVTYSNAAKTEMLGVPADLIQSRGAVSESVARAMAAGAIAHSGAAASVAVTGIAGPGGGTADKPVGLVHFATNGPAGPIYLERRFSDVGRESIRLESVRVALRLLLDQVRA